MRAKQTKYIRARIFVVAFFFGLAFVAVGVRAVHLQVFSEELSVKAESEYKKSVISHGGRGSIYDRNGKEFAVSVKVISIAAHPKRIKNKKSASRRLGAALSINSKAIFSKLKSDKSFVWIKRKISPKETAAVKKLNIGGVGFFPEFQRYYPDKRFAGQALGFSGVDGKGLEGIEFYYNHRLAGGTGKSTVYKDAFGRSIDAGGARAADHSGQSIVLTIDKTIQFISENALKRAVDFYSAKSGIALVMVPSTGELLSVANYPGFNPNAFGDFQSERWRNRSIADQFEPGSTMKIFTAAAALESGKIFSDTIVFCENGKYRVGKNIIHDIKPYGWLSLGRVIQYSSNIGAVKIAEMAGPEALHRALRYFGFGQKTGIDCPGETPGFIAPYRSWSKIDTGAIAFGQGVSVSAIQMIAAVSAIANRGNLMKPYVVKEIKEPDGTGAEQFYPVKVRRAVTERTAETIKEMMKRVTEKNGTGVRAALRRHTVCGKTGTSQKHDESGGYSDDRHIASFVGFAPAKTPAISVAVIINEPKGEYYGGVVAAPVFQEIADKTLTYLNVYPDKEYDGLRASGKHEVNG